MNITTFKIEKDKLVIEIPNEFLEHLVTTFPDTEIKILDRDEMIKNIAFQLEHCLGDPETGLTGFQQLLEDSIEQVIEGGNDCLDVKFNGY